MAKKRTSINELAQLDQAYGRKLTLKRQISIALKPAIITTLFSFILLGVVGIKPQEQANIVKSLPEYAKFHAADPEDADLYLTNIEKAKNKQYWEGDMPSLKRGKESSASQSQAKNFEEAGKAYDDLQEAYKKKTMIPNIIKSVLSLWRELIFFIIGFVYGWYYILPRQIKLEYNMSALTERNAAINLLTQAFADTTQPPVFALQVARDNTHGKLKDDFRLLSSIVSKRESDQAILDAFRNLRHEYADDVQFDLFMEQVTTYIIKGDISQKTFNNIMRQHNSIMGTTITFQQHKDARVKKLQQLMYMSFGVGLFVAFVVMAILGSSMFIDKVWGGLTGIGGSLVIAGGTLVIYSLMMKAYFDNDLMSI